MTRDLLFAYWRDHNFLIHYYVFQLFFNMVTEIYPEEWNKVPVSSGVYDMFNAIMNGEKYSDELMKSFEVNHDFHRLTYKEVAPNQWETSAIMPSLIEIYRNNPPSSH